jgi:hypothetical protein
MSEPAVIKKWNARAHKALTGRKIVGARYMTSEEQKSAGWDQRALVVVLDDGTFLMASSDEEGNEAGTLYHDGKDVFPAL